MHVKSSPFAGPILGSPALPMLSAQLCLKCFPYSLQLVSTVNLVLKMLHSFAPYPLRPPAN